MIDECYKLNDDELESEECVEDSPMDEIYVLDGRGRMVKLEVKDDVSDD